MNKLLLLTTLALTSHLSIAQQSYEIQNLGSNYSTIQINDAFANAEFCGFYYISGRRELKFDDGTIIELFESSELPNLELGCFISDNGANNSNVWSITASGHLIRTIETPPSKN
jgi:hypothetical protein